MKIEQLYQLFLNANGITIDTRKIKSNQLYFALKGANFNGNLFAKNALEAGASYAIIDEAAYKMNDQYILVEDVLTTLQQLANFHLKNVKPSAIIAITGSNGKTTTKELVHAVLTTTFKTHYTKGNLNNHIGIPLTLLEMPLDTEIAVIEMGANHQKEIESYCQYVEPTHGIITNCGKAHLEGFSGLEGIRKGKGELYDYIKTHKGTVFVNGDDEILLEMLQQRAMHDFISYGNNPKNAIHSQIVNEQPYLKINFENTLIQSNLFGNYNYSNIMCAVAVGSYFKVKNEAIKDAIENYQPTNARSQVVDKQGYQIVLDAYNANPTSMQHALENFSKSTNKKKIVLLGDMFELGEFATQEHQRIADLAMDLNFDKIILVGNEFYKTKSNESVLKFDNVEIAQQWYKQQDFTDAMLLLKGSRSMQMERIVQ